MRHIHTLRQRIAAVLLALALVGLVASLATPAPSEIRAASVVAMNWSGVRDLGLTLVWSDGAFACYRAKNGHLLVGYRKDLEPTIAIWGSPSRVSATAAAIGYAGGHQVASSTVAALWANAGGPVVPLSYVLDITANASDSRPLLVLTGHGSRTPLRISPQFYAGDTGRLDLDFTPAEILDRLPVDLLAGRHVVVGACNPEADSVTGPAVLATFPGLAGVQVLRSGNVNSGELFTSQIWETTNPGHSGRKGM